MSKRQQRALRVAVPFVVFDGVLLWAVTGDASRDVRAGAIVVALVVCIAASTFLLVAMRRADRRSGGA